MPVKYETAAGRKRRNAAKITGRMQREKEREREWEGEKKVEENERRGEEKFEGGRVGTNRRQRECGADRDGE